tara:strand:- start:87 stop:329 length:243 start_codon:yes stop_codon:yes gene_type:complete
MPYSKSSFISDYEKMIIVAKTNNKRKTKCNKGHDLTQNPSKPKYRICLTCQKNYNKQKNDKLQNEKNELQNKKFKFFGIT